MLGKRIAFQVGLLAVLSATGCCSMCDRWCGHHGQAPVAAYGAPACVPCYSAPVSYSAAPINYQPQPGTVAAYGGAPGQPVSLARQTMICECRPSGQ